MEDELEMSGRPGSLDLALTVAPGIEVSEVAYEVKGNGIQPRAGTVDLTAPGATISLVIGGLPPGNGYRIGLNARTDHQTSCAGSAPFSVIANQISAVRVDLDCGESARPPATGGVSVMGNRCPTIGALTASPTMVAPGGSIILLASAFDPDPSDVLSYQWTGGAGGTFADATAPNTRFRFSQPGRTTLQLTVSDGHCSKSKEVAVSCGAPVTGGPSDGGPGPVDVRDAGFGNDVRQVNDARDVRDAHDAQRDGRP